MESQNAGHGLLIAPQHINYMGIAKGPSHLDIREIIRAPRPLGQRLTQTKGTYEPEMKNGPPREQMTFFVKSRSSSLCCSNSSTSNWRCCFACQRCKRCLHSRIVRPDPMIRSETRSSLITISSRYRDSNGTENARAPLGVLFSPKMRTSSLAFDNRVFTFCRVSPRLARVWKYEERCLRTSGPRSYSFSDVIISCNCEK